MKSTFAFMHSADRQQSTGHEQIFFIWKAKANMLNIIIIEVNLMTWKKIASAIFVWTTTTTTIKCLHFNCTD